MGKKSILFVCLGNICRSPIAEAVFIDLIKKRQIESNWDVDSAAIGPWHIGKKPDARALSTLKNHGIEYNSRARQVALEDFTKYDYILGMDDENISDLKRLAPANSRSVITIICDFDPDRSEYIRDPYYDRGSEGFEECYIQCVRCLDSFLNQFG